MKRKKERTCIVTGCIAVVATLIIVLTGCDGLFGGDDDVELIVGPGYFTSIQAVIDLAVDGDTIILLPGEYKEAINFNGKNITIRSATHDELVEMEFDFPGDPADFDIVAATIIDGGGAETVIALDSGTEREAVIKGLTITGGGRGIYVRAGSVVTITDNVIENNTNGGIVLVASSSNADASVTPSEADITGNTIRNNVKSVGAGVYLGQNAQAVIEDNVFTNNTATEQASAYGGGAIGLYTFHSHDTVNVIRDNTFTDNTAYRVGGAIFLMGSNAVTTITGNSFSGNEAITHFQASGGGIYIRSCQKATIHGNTFTDNTAVWRGGAMRILSAKTYGSGNTLMTDANYGTFNDFTGNTAPTGNDIYID